MVLNQIRVDLKQGWAQRVKDAAAGVLLAEAPPVTDPAAPCKGSRVRDHHHLKDVTMFWKTMRDGGAVGSSSKIQSVPGLSLSLPETN